jgi:hypothetical protein
MVFGTPHVTARCVFAHVEVEIVISFMTWAEVKDRGAQAYRWQQPRLEVVKLDPAGSGPGNVEAPRAHQILIDSPHNAFRIGVGAADQVERFVLRWMDGVTC